MIIKRDLSTVLDEATMIFENVPDINGNIKNEDGSPRIWKITPLTVDREHDAERARMKNTAYLQKLITTNQLRWKAVEEGRTPTAEEQTAIDEDLDPLATAEQWAPIVAALVSEPQLDADDLIEEFHGAVLRIVGEDAESFFRELPERLKKNKELNRAERRANR